MQARQVGNRIASILEQTKDDDESSRGANAASKRRKRYKIVIHSSPFLRCVQTSIGISSGLAQTSSDSIYNLSEFIVPRAAPESEPRFQFKTTLLRLDSFLGEWLSPEYFEMITPPPGPALMLGGAKAELLRRYDYSAYTDVTIPDYHRQHRASSGSLWQSPTASPAHEPESPSSDDAINLSSLDSALPVKPLMEDGYTAPRPLHHASGGGSIPEGFVAHARDATVTVDYQWDSMRAPLNFGDGGTLGEEWPSMHKRFRSGLRKLLNWYAKADSPADLATSSKSEYNPVIGSEVGETVETVVIIVSHGAGCNALIGAITHQPVLMDIAIASITMASRKPNFNYEALLSATPAPSDPSDKTLVAVDKMYDIRLTASTEHLRRSTNSTPISARSSAPNVSNPGSRGRTATLSTTGGPVMSPFTYSEPFSFGGSRSTSASAAVGSTIRRESEPQRPSLPKGSALASVGFGSVAGSGATGNRSPPPASASASASGLWAPLPSTLRLMDDGSDDSDDFDSMMPNFDQTRFTSDVPASTVKKSEPPFLSTDQAAWPLSGIEPPRPSNSPQPPMFAGPITVHTNLGPERPVEVEELKVTQLGAGLGGLWGTAPLPDEAERFRDMSHTKRRWTVNERA